MRRRSANLRLNLTGSATQRLAFDNETNRTLNVRVMQAGTEVNVTTMGAAIATGNAGLMAMVTLRGYNGTNLDDLWRNNAEVTVFASAARTATVASSEITNYNGRGARFHLTITAASGTTPTLDIAIRSRTGAVVLAIAGAAFAQKTTTGDDELVVYPGIAETANESVSDILGRLYDANATIGGTSPSFTFALFAVHNV